MAFQKANIKNIGLFTKAQNDRTRGNGIKLNENRFRLDIRKTFFVIGVSRHWNWLHREVMDALLLEEFSAGQGFEQSDLVT